MKSMVTVVALLAAGSVVSEPVSQPPIGWTTEAEVVRVIDGDTIVVAVTRKVRIRLLDCWAPETKAQSKIKDAKARAAEKQRGLASKQHMEKLVLGKPVVVHIPAGRNGDLNKVFTFGRALGSVWQPGIADSLSKQMVAAGHAEVVKP
jgi:endonuclease YncB( thermonuclease family)